MKAVLDTNVLIDGHFELEDEFQLAVASISFAELRFGADRKGLSPSERALRAQRLTALEQRFASGLPFDDRAAASYGTIARLTEDSGRAVRGRAVDLMIAAVAHSNGAVLVTSNLPDFAPLRPVLSVVPPTSTP
ncbi:MAG: PIN domain-containing protein [Bifidobacteriaceae bacterium]|jgi:predicted nucleic acid-binding protein|nr:PIN domain-containing protein [Bifidobacteriaceae bacterium]